jgi:hypothetical protein
MPNDYEFTDPPTPSSEDIWDDDLIYEIPAMPSAPPDYFSWVFDGSERFAACHTPSEGYHVDLLARFDTTPNGGEFAMGAFDLHGERVELKIYSEGPAVDRGALQAHISAFLRAREPATRSRYSRHLRSFVWADGQLELERDGERVAHAELERRLWARMAQPAKRAIHGEVWQRGRRRHAAHTPAPDLDLGALRAALGSALPGPTIEFEQIDAEHR